MSQSPNEEILRRLETIEAPVRRLISSFEYGKLVHDGFTLAIVGKPNVGKSSLFNRLLEQDRAIVTEIAGTTRDLVSESSSIDGLPVKFLDTAGIRQGQDLIESLGIERSYQAITDADLTLVVLDLSTAMDDHDRAVLDRTKERGGSTLLVGNKADLPSVLESEAELLPVSATTGQGIPELRRRIVEVIAPGESAQEPGFLTSIRHEGLLRESLEALENARRAVELGIPQEMLLLDLYAALRPIDAITGATTADDILNRIFTTFCIGK